MDKEKEIQKIDPKQKKNKNKSIKGYVMLLLASGFIVSLGVYITICTVTIGASSAEKAFQEEMKNSKEKAFAEKEEYAYQISYDVAEATNHVKNRVTLQLGNIQENANLEVLEVSGTEIVIEKSENNEEKNEAWLEVIAKGVYTIDMSWAEFIFDSENQHVWARVSKPVLNRDHFGVIEDKKILFKNDKFLGNGSIPGGENLRQKMKQEGSDKIFQSLVSNQEYYENAESSAEVLITNLLKELNPEFDDLKVEVQFME